LFRSRQLAANVVQQHREQDAGEDQQQRVGREPDRGQAKEKCDDHHIHQRHPVQE
jgi:hypothetical protein